jgi:DNA-binding transcriptional MerR regulator
MKTLIITLLFLFISMFAFANTTQNNTSGSNTSITGGYTSSATNTYQSGSSNNTTTTNNTSSNIRSAPPTAAAPNITNSGSDVCLSGASGGIQTFGLGVSGGKYFRDKNCERIKLSRELNSLGMKVAAVAILCQDERVFEAMEQAGTPCPFEGKIGKDAKQAWKKYNKLRPDHKQYVKNLEIKEKADEQEIKQMTIEFEKIEKENKKSQIKNKKNIDWESPK